MQKPNRRLVDLADWDGDGQVEVFAQPVDDVDAPFLEVWDLVNGGWTFSEWAVPAPASGLSWRIKSAILRAMGVLEVPVGTGGFLGAGVV